MMWLLFNATLVGGPLKNISQNGILPQIGVNIKKTWNHRQENKQVIAV